MNFYRPWKKNAKFTYILKNFFTLLTILSIDKKIQLMVENS